MWWPLRKEGLRERNIGVVTVNNNKVRKILPNFRQGKELSKHLLFVNFQSVCAWKWEVEDFSLIWVGTHFHFSCWRERHYYLLFYT